MLRYVKITFVSFVATVFFIILVPSTIIWFLKAGNLPLAAPIRSSSSGSHRSLVKVVDAKQSIATQQPVRLGWVTGSLSQGNLSDYHGLNVVSPSLGSITRSGQLVLQQATRTDALHNEGIRVWARLTFDQDTPGAVHAFLSDAEKRQSIVQKIAQNAREKRWDGINIDIENVSDQDRSLFSIFIQELSTSLHTAHLSLSVDIPPDHVPGRNSASPFNHTILGQYCDEVVLMGYDEHWASDPTPGPTTSMPWLKSDVDDLTSTGIPAQKIILGLPAYTRIWEQDRQGNVIQNPAYSFRYVDELLQKSHEPLVWNSDLDQFYSSYVKDSDTFKVWLADTESLRMYLSIVANDHLAGSAIWSLDLMGVDDWNQLFASNTGAF